MCESMQLGQHYWCPEQSYVMEVDHDWLKTQQMTHLTITAWQKDTALPPPQYLCIKLQVTFSHIVPPKQQSPKKHTVPNMRRVNLTKFNMGAQLLWNLDSLRQVLNEWHIFLQVTRDHKACRQAATSGTVKWSQASNCSYANGYLKLAPKLSQSPQTAMLKCPTKAYLQPGAKTVLFLYG